MKSNVIPKTVRGSMGYRKTATCVYAISGTINSVQLSVHGIFAMIVDPYNCMLYYLFYELEISIR